MSRTATRATAALLCGVVLVALGLAFIATPDSATAPESLTVEIDFDTFAPGVTQTRTSNVDVPVPSRVDEARVDIVGEGVELETDLSICQLDDCQPLVAGLELRPGPYTLSVAATLDREVAPGATGDLIGQIRIVETRQPTAIDTTMLVTVACIGLLAIALGVQLVTRRREVMS
jgi:hypothetical protein